ncbi:MAG: hypothetical protein JNK89_08910 [Saprospiraceae bacterium]|nr:hypothetical protein [Saprospiraceae bacterium]
MLLISKLGQSQTGAAPQTFFEYLTAKEAAEITLEADLTTLLADRRSTEYEPGILTLANGKSYTVKLMPKGKFRRKIAEVPPLKIKLPKKTLQEQGLVDSLNELKLVLPCFNTRQGDALMVKEYLIYQMFERLTHVCVRARLVRVTLRDNHAGNEAKIMYGLLVEDNEETAARLQGVELDQYGLPADSLVAQQAALVTMFEYMIGNTDWDIPMQRNVRLIRSKAFSKILVAPYDFDFSGLVAAPYASPSSDAGLESVMDRYLMSNGITKEALRQATQVLKSAQKDFYDLCYSKHLPREETRMMHRYLDTFFNNIDKNYDVPVKMSVPVSAR